MRLHVISRALLPHHEWRSDGVVALSLFEEKRIRWMKLIAQSV